MKLIHCADLHLDPAMTSIEDREKAGERKRELLLTFERMLRFAAENGVEVILLAGDLFDRSERSSYIEKMVASMIGAYPEIRFYYASGNHDAGSAAFLYKMCPDNLSHFDGGWHSYTEAGGRICITGAGQAGGRRLSLSAMPELDQDVFNIVMMHGQLTSSGPDETTESIDIKSFAGKNIDYMALGHIHSYMYGQIDGRGTWAYPGCLEGRGFDECGEHGFILLDIDVSGGRYSHAFIPFASRRVYSLDVDLEGCDDTIHILERIKSQAEEAGCSRDSMVRVCLRGSLDVSCQMDLAYVKKSLEDIYYYVRVQDETSFSVDLEGLMEDLSLRGEFVRQVMMDISISDEDRPEVIRYGLMALDGTDEGWQL